MTNKQIDLDYILSKNKTYVDAFNKSPLMELIQSTNIDNSKSRALLLDCIQVFSNYFQKTVMLRSTLNEENQYLKIAREHLEEEFGHDISLLRDRNQKAPFWDPILDACSCWFSWKMLTLDNAEKTLLVHLVLEASANIFFVKAHNIMVKYDETDYFKIHAEVDEHHSTMGLELLRDLREVDYQALAKVQSEGWDMLNAVCNRISEISCG
ncbi:MAG: hypothetical protein P1U74_07145 [Legionellaceae bacterium]|nr:hypothetical protein [Legionellaceae bacterium]